MRADLRLESARLLPACIPFFACIVGVIANHSGREANTATLELALLCLPVAWVLLIGSSRWCDAWIQRFVGAALALVAWMVGEELLNPRALPAGWWHLWERSAAIATALFVLSSGVDARQFLRVLGAACACAALVIGALDWQQGFLVPMLTATVAFGHINCVTTTLGPPLLAWAVMTVVLWRRGEHVPLADRLLLAGGLAALAAISITTHRRGAPVAAAAVCGWFALQWSWRRSRVAAVALVAAAVAAVLWLYLPQALASVPDPRAERFWIYRAACEAIARSPWFGYGHYGMLHLQWSGGDAAGHFAAAGHGGSHAHNEVLDVLLDGGPVAAALFLAVLAIAAWRALHIADPALRAACQAVLVAAGVHLMTDNYYATNVGQACLWIILALVMIAPSSAPAPRLWRWRWFPAPQLAILPLVLIAGFAANRTVRPAVMPGDASLADRMLTLHNAYEPQLVYQLAKEIALIGVTGVSRQEARDGLAEGMRKIGPTLDLPRLAATLAIVEGDGDEAARWLTATLRNAPFEPWAYRQLGNLLRQRPDLSAGLPPEVAQRAQLVRGRGHIDEAALERDPRTFAELVDLHFATRWAIANHWEWKLLSRALETQARQGGDIAGIEMLVVTAATAAPPGTFPWLADCAASLAIGANLDNEMVKHWQAVTTPTQVEAVMPLLCAWYPRLIADCERGHRDAGQRPDAAVELDNQVVRIVGLWRRHRNGKSPTRRSL